MLPATLGHTGYYHNFIKGYTTITTPMEKLLKKDASYEWTQECQGSFDTLKAKMASVPIWVFLDWDKEFHVHVDASYIAVGVILAQPGEADLDHPITYSSRKLSFAERNYTATEREGLVMVYALQNFQHYLLGVHFKMFIDHSTLQYLVNNPLLGGKICRWLLLF